MSFLNLERLRGMVREGEGLEEEEEGRGSLFPYRSSGSIEEEGWVASEVEVVPGWEVEEEEEGGAEEVEVAFLDLRGS